MPPATRRRPLHWRTTRPIHHPHGCQPRRHASGHFSRLEEIALNYAFALKTTGIAIFYTALTLAVGVAMWIFSVLKFQADMGILLAFMFFLNMLGALFLLPALAAFLLKPHRKVVSGTN